MDEDYSSFNWKLAVMFLACLAGCTAQFYPLPFPDNRLLLSFCVIVYFALSGLYQYNVWYWEKDYVYFSKQKVRSDGAHMCVRVAVHAGTL